MKKLLVVLSLGVFVACSNDTAMQSTEDYVHAADSVNSAQADAVDSANSAQRNNIDSMNH